jgi:hypothetical protein
LQVQHVHLQGSASGFDAGADVNVWVFDGLPEHFDGGLPEPVRDWPFERASSECDIVAAGHSVSPPGSSSSTSGTPPQQQQHVFE